MNVSLNFTEVTGSVLIPPSKSMMQRVCAAALLHQGKTIVRNYGTSKDDEAAITIIKDLGATVHFTTNEMIVESSGTITGGGNINCGESGLSARLFTPIAALGNRPVLITGNGSLPGRPMQFFKDVLEPLGVKMEGFTGYIPFIAEGPLQVQDITVDGSLSSQFISGILFAYAAAAKEAVQVTVTDLVSRPYIDLTLEVLTAFGKNITNDNYQRFIINPVVFRPANDIQLSIEGDWSSAVFWIAAASIKGSLILTGLEQESVQADKLILEIVQKAGAKLHWQNKKLQISADKLSAFEVDLTNAPDLFPVLAVLAACCKGNSSIKGLHRLVYKESNRAESIFTLLSLLEVDFFLEGDQMMICGKDSFPAINYINPNDHRMAMAGALAAMRCTGEISIHNAEAVEKSYPDFWCHLDTFSKL